MSDQNLTPEMRREILAQYYESGKAIELDMSLYRSGNKDCGTTACIAGSTIYLFDKYLWDTYETDFITWHVNVGLKAAELLGLKKPESGIFDDDHLFLQFKIKTPQQAAAALRALNVKADANV